jgi:hypothetical protein
MLLGCAAVAAATTSGMTVNDEMLMSGCLRKRSPQLVIVATTKPKTTAYIFFE